MHEGETAISPGLAARLVAEQFPQWADLAMRPTGGIGSDNVMIRLGKGMVLRFPRLPGAVSALEVETQWLGWIAEKLPFAVPEVVAVGRPGLGYPYPWAVLQWIPGKDALAAPMQDQAAEQALATVVASLRAVAPPQGTRVMRGSLRERDGFLRQMIRRITDEADPAEVTRAWERALTLPEWVGDPVLVHADLHPLNLITRNGALAAVIDWGCFGAGDPALDLICAWTVLEPVGRDTFRRRLAVDDATWARGWAYAFSKAVMAAPYYRATNPLLRKVMLRTLHRCVVDRPE